MRNFRTFLVDAESVEFAHEAAWRAAEAAGFDYGRTLAVASRGNAYLVTLAAAGPRIVVPEAPAGAIATAHDDYAGEWLASRSDFDPESPIGRGATPEAAIADLLDE